MWPPDRKLYAFLLFVWALFLVVSLDTVSPEEHYLMTQNELRLLLEISDNLKENSLKLSSEVAIWKENSERLDAELETLSDEMETLRNEYDLQKPLLTELGNMLKKSETQAGELAQKLRASEAIATGLEASTTRLAKDLSKSNKEKGLWRIAAMVAGAIAAMGWIMILWYP
jgi:septal ring factor EnvC (AmiA/AmiB activator)